MKITPEYVKAQAARNCERRPDLVNPEHKAIVEAGGGVYEPGMMADLVLFDSPATGSTLAIKESDLTSENVACKIANSNKEFKCS